MSVRVWHDPDRDVVQIGASPAGPAGLGLVELAGAELAVDPSAPDEAPFAVVHDGAEAMAGLEAVYGQDVAEAVTESFGRVGEGEQVDLHPGRAWDAVRTIGLVTWLDSHSPDLLPAALLDVQLGAAVAELGGLAVEHLRDDGEERLARRTDLVVDLARELREPGAPVAPAGLPELVTRALEQLALVLPADDPVHDDVEHEEELARALRTFGPAGIPLDWALLVEQPGVGGRRLLGATSAGLDESATGSQRRSSVDWLQVPRGLLDTAEDTVEWSLIDADTDRSTVQVAVRAAPGAPDSARLAFRVYAADFPLPVAMGSLRRSADATVFAGSARVLMPAQGMLTIDVHDARDTRPPRLGVDAMLARAARWTARGVTTLRLGGTAPEALDTARGALEEAGALFAEAADALVRPGVRTAARRREARCAALVRATLWHGGHVRMAELLDGPWSPPPPPATPLDVTTPDLDATGWTPLVAEQAFRADPRRWSR